jgi:S1-C subfamily serine protease
VAPSVTPTSPSSAPQRKSFAEVLGSDVSLAQVRPGRRTSFVLSGAGMMVLGAVAILLIQLSLGLKPTRPLSLADQRASISQRGNNGINVNRIYAAASPSILQVESTISGSAQAAPDGEFQGTGFVVAAQGKRYVITNYHVVQGAKQIHLVLQDGTRVLATVRGEDQSIDIAVLEAPGLGPALSFHPSHTLVVGDPVMALGNPLGLVRSASAGIVSAVGRDLRAPNSYTINGVIEIDAALDHGSSGGPLLDASGRVVGVTTAIASSTSQFGFAVPADLVQAALPRLVSGAKPKYAWAGVRMSDLTPGLAAALHLPATGGGAMIVSVTPEGPAAKAGLRGGTRDLVLAGQKLRVGGDVIISADDAPVLSFSDLSSAIALRQPGYRMKIEFWRGAKLRTTTLVLGERPNA